MIQIHARAKVNLYLKVLGKRPDGYHAIDSVMMRVPLADTIRIRPAPDGEIAVSGVQGVPEESNLAYRAAMLLKKASGSGEGAQIEIEKHIPMGSGMGGGSADAAAVLNALNRLWNCGMSREDLSALAADIGSDIPGMIWDCPVHVEGRGEIVHPVPDWPVPDVSRLVLQTPPVFASTPRVYSEFRMSDCGVCKNDLQPAACRLYPQIAETIANLTNQGCQNVLMSGSGSTVFAFRP